MMKDTLKVSLFSFYVFIFCFLLLTNSYCEKYLNEKAEIKFLTNYKGKKGNDVVELSLDEFVFNEVIFHDYSESKAREKFKVFVENADIPILGKYEIENHRVIFRPLFGFTENISYIAKFFSSPSHIVKYSFKTQPIDYPKGKVIHIYPKSDKIAENLLRFYLYFSSPMREGEFLNYIKLYGEDGKNLTNIFFDNQYELWNIDHTRLTILIDPGRVKTGLASHKKFGRAFEIGKKYKLVIDKNWLTIPGGPLDQDYEMIFTGVKEDRKSPDIKNWKLHYPKVHSKDPLKITFDETLDHIQIKRFISIADDKNEIIPGNISIINHGSGLEFTPIKKWLSGNYKILINSRLEDLVGNNLNGLFDHKINELKSQKEGEILTIKFKVQN